MSNGLRDVSCSIGQFSIEVEVVDHPIGGSHVSASSLALSGGRSRTWTRPACDLDGMIVPVLVAFLQLHSAESFCPKHSGGSLLGFSSLSRTISRATASMFGSLLELR